MCHVLLSVKLSVREREMLSERDICSEGGYLIQYLLVFEAHSGETSENTRTAVH